MIRWVRRLLHRYPQHRAIWTGSGRCVLCGEKRRDLPIDWGSTDPRETRQ